jgi:hypothetical protein
MKNYKKDFEMSKKSIINTVRSGRTTEKNTVVDKNALASLGFLTQKKTILYRKNIFGHRLVKNKHLKPSFR